MTHKAPVQPLCRFCGEGVRKATHTVYFGHSRHRVDDYSTERQEKPTSREEAQRLLNQSIVSVSWAMDWSSGKGQRDYIRKVTTWDGESWIDPFFCKGEHARDFGYAAARGGQVMAEYRIALAEQQERLQHG